ncbi:MAG TPA: hypothetical protein VH111_02180 [Steroidobacteraceae bacterium]|jgi:hypothetical protein|nr:hypothetical protein [Steroidobacteraceae bacterium]
MRVLFRVALTLLVGIPLCLALILFFVLDLSRSASSPVDRRGVGSPEKAQLGPHRAAT